MMRVISLGGGAQSSAMVPMALDGRFGDIPDCAIFADTQWEPKAVYVWLSHIFGIPYEQIPGTRPSRYRAVPGTYSKIGLPVHVVTAGDIYTDATAGTGTNKVLGCSRVAALPYFTKGWDQKAIVDEANDDAIIGYEEVATQGMARRHCSDDYKLVPIRKKLRESGATAKNPGESWLGISLDEAIRMKPSQVKYAVNRFPLIDARLRREDCQDYLIKMFGKPAPKSACVGCPFHDDAYWARLKAESPDDFEQAVQFDRLIRTHPSMRHERFLHRSRVPLGDIKEFRHEKQGRMFMDGFGNECEGICST